MKVYFRELEEKDILGIIDISKDIWEGQDYIPTVIEDWLSDENSYNYGGFSDKKRQNLIGFGRVKFLSEIAWLEGGRVKKSLHNKGIGRKLMEHAIIFAKNQGFKKAQYDTSTENKGSLALADYFGFTEKDNMFVLEYNPDRDKLVLNNAENLRDINAYSFNQVIPIYKSIENGPKEELHVGWSFVPLQEQFLENKNWKWFSKSQAIIQYYNMVWKLIGKDNLNELRLIVYGDDKEAIDLIKYVLSEGIERNNYDFIELFCRPNVVENAKEIGFSYPDYTLEEEEIIKVILFEKDLSIKQ